MARQAETKSRRMWGGARSAVTAARVRSLTEPARLKHRLDGWLLQLRGAPLRAQLGHEPLRNLVDRNALLLERVAIAHRHGAVLERLVVERHAPRRADLVLAAVALADRARLVGFRLHDGLERRVDLAC